MMDNRQIVTAFFSELDVFLENTVASISHDLDSNPNLLKRCYQKLIEIGGLRLLIPVIHGGLGGERSDWIRYASKLAEYSGALQFLQAQHQYSISKLKKLLPNEKIDALFHSLIQKNQGIGVSFSANKNILDVKKQPHGFTLSGTLQWVTGYDYYSHIFFSFDNKGTDYYILLPFKTSEPSIVLSPVLSTIVFSAANTVTISLNNFFISDNQIIAQHPSLPKQMTEHPAVYNLIGILNALLKIVSQARYSHLPSVKSKLNQLIDEYKQYYENVIQEKISSPMELRAMGIKLAEKFLFFYKSGLR